MLFITIAYKNVTVRLSPNCYMRTTSYIRNCKTKLMTNITGNTGTVAKTIFVAISTIRYAIMCVPP